METSDNRHGLTSEFKPNAPFAGQTLGERTYDVFIIGSGINGAVSAAALAGAGYKVCLVDKGDFASFTSQESSYLVWGGIKYLENFEFTLVRKLCMSRNKLLRSFPTKIREIRFFFPRDRKNRNGVIKLFLGTLLYWIMGNFFTKMPLLFTKSGIRRAEPVVKLDTITAGVDYSDAYLPDGDARFVFEFVKSARQNGAVTLNYVKCSELSRDGDDWVAELTDEKTGDQVKIRSEVVLNCGGPFADGNNDLFEVQSKHKHILSKGVHLVVDGLTQEERVITLFSDDGRMFFILPLGKKSCLGTTDTRVTDLPPVVTDEDRDFILSQINTRLNLKAPLTKADIISERCGVRPLVVEKQDASAGDDQEWTNLSRKHITETDKERRYLTIFGGKLTDCLNVGDEIAHIVHDKFKVRSSRPKKKWYGEPKKRFRRKFMKLAKREMPALLTIETGKVESRAARLWRRYSQDSFHMLEAILKEPHLAEESITGSDILWIEVQYSAKNELNRDLEDFLRRRTNCYMQLGPKGLLADKNLPEVAEILFPGQGADYYNQYLAKLSAAPV